MKLLRKSLVTRPCPRPKLLHESELKNSWLDSLLVSVNGKLNGWHREGNAVMLEMQSGAEPFLARLNSGNEMPAYPRVGSLLALTGVYAAQGGDQRMGNKVGCI